MSELLFPLDALNHSRWFKLICGASFQHLPSVRNLALAYGLAGADCIDVAADPAVIAAAQAGLAQLEVWAEIARKKGFQPLARPWLMVSLNDGEDPHFRKAAFDPAVCPADCPRPCEQVCPADAIQLAPRSANAFPGGVIDERCYGCGRCIPICPQQLIYTRSYVSAPEAIAPLVFTTGVDALEIHTQVGRLTDFARLWQGIRPWVGKLKLLAISCPDGEGLIDYLRSLYHLIQPLPCPLVWQTDGRPMSGDIGKGTTHAAIQLAQKVLSAGLPGYVQLAGGTNHHTVGKLKRMGLLPDRGSSPTSPTVAGVAYGSYARVLLSPLLESLEVMAMQDDRQTPSLSGRLESQPELLWKAVQLAHGLVGQIKDSVSLTWTE